MQMMLVLAALPILAMGGCASHRSQPPPYDAAAPDLQTDVLMTVDGIDLHLDAMSDGDANSSDAQVDPQDADADSSDGPDAGCVGEGEATFSTFGADCCSGLVAIRSGLPPPGYPPFNCSVGLDSRVCSRCGDGICDQWERPCGCPQDCDADGGARLGDAAGG